MQGIYRLGVAWIGGRGLQDRHVHPCYHTLTIMQWGGHSISQGRLMGGNTVAVLQQTYSTLLSASISKLESHKDQAYNKQTSTPLSWGGDSMGQGRPMSGNTVAVLQHTYSTLLSATAVSWRATKGPGLQQAVKYTLVMGWGQHGSG